MTGKLGSYLLIYAVGLLIFLFLIVVLPGKRKNKQVQAMHNAVKLGDEISTIGGIIGTVTERDENTVTILIDAKTGTTMKIVVQAVQSILTPSEQAAKSE